MDYSDGEETSLQQQKTEKEEAKISPVLSLVQMEMNKLNTSTSHLKANCRRRQSC